MGGEIVKANMSQIWQQISSTVLGDMVTPVQRHVDPNGELVDLVERARLDWMAAKSYFDNVSDPDLIDHAIHSVDAAEKKYVYLLRQARELNVSLHW